MKRIKLGVVGAAGRGGHFRDIISATGAIDVVAVCDSREAALEEARQRFAAPEKYVDYREMLAKSDIDAVFIGTPMPLHAEQSIAALDSGRHVISEVTAAVSLDECRRLVSAVRRSKRVYMMAENYIYMHANAIVSELVRQGLFGEVFYAAAEYIHELKELNEQTPWRRRCQTGVPGITYGTHSLGPILQWMPGDRVASVACANSGSHYRDPRGEPYAQDTASMMCRTVQGRMIVIRVDMVSDRPHACGNYQLQGTDGCFESSRGGPGDIDKIWLKRLPGTQAASWRDLGDFSRIPELKERFVPSWWREAPAAALKAGHGGGDFFELWDFVRAVRGESPCRLGIDAAMDMTLPGLVSQQAVAASAWLEVPDSRAWM